LAAGGGGGGGGGGGVVLPLRLESPAAPPAPRPTRYLNGKGLSGSIPADASVWSGLPGLTKLDLSNNPGVTGAVPEALAAAPALFAM
jgi:hypothetical protein